MLLARSGRVTNIHWGKIPVIPVWVSCFLLCCVLLRHFAHLAHNCAVFCVVDQQSDLTRRQSFGGHLHRRTETARRSVFVMLLRSFHLLIWFAGLVVLFPPTLTSAADNGTLCAENAISHALVPDFRFWLFLISHDTKSEAFTQQWCRCKKWCRPIRIKTTVFFESIIYSYFHHYFQMTTEWNDLQYIGIATYKSIRKGSRAKLNRGAEVAVKFPMDFDVIPLINSGKNLMAQAIDGHSMSFKVVWYQFLSFLGFNSTVVSSADNVQVFYRNTFFVRPKVLVSLSEFMVEAMEATVHNAEIKMLLSNDSKYPMGTFGSLEVARRVFNQSYYEYHPFIFERLPVFYFHHHNISVYQTRL